MNNLSRYFSNINRNKGYSMIVLVIAIVVILILAGTAVSSLRSSRQRTDIMNFIFDIIKYKKVSFIIIINFIFW